MKRAIMVLVILVLLSQGGICRAQSTVNAWTGNDLLRKLTTGTHSEQLTSMGFVIGCAMTYELLMDSDLLPRTFQVPSNADIGQVIDVVISFLKAHPEIRHFDAPALIGLAFKERFPPRGR